MYLLTSQEMRRLDELSIGRDGIPSLTLMENAGRQTFLVIKKIVPKLRGRKIFIFCGPGGNGGDGLVLLRHLLKGGAKAEAFCLFSRDQLKGDPLEVFQKLGKGEKNVFFISPFKSLRKKVGGLGKPHFVVDALFGTGLARPLEGIFREAVDWLNSLEAKRLAIDIPSGLSSDSGEILGTTFTADHTVALGFPKRGLFVGGGSERCGEIHVVPIGLSEKAIAELKSETHLITRGDVGIVANPRKKRSHKGTYGHAFTIGGSTGKIGAGVMAASAALKGGAGLSTLVLPRSAYDRIDPTSLEIMVEPVEDSGNGFFREVDVDRVLSKMEKASVASLGPGLGMEEETVAFVRDFVRRCPLPLIVDADGLNAVARSPAILSERKGFTLLTPHPTEMARLIRKTTEEVQRNRIGTARVFAMEHRVHVVLKGYRSVVAFPDGEVWINPTGGPAMASAGAGDVLTGICAGLISEFGPVKEGVLAGPFLHGLVGDLLAKKGNRVVMATEILKNLRLGYQFLKKRSELLSTLF